MLFSFDRRGARHVSKVLAFLLSSLPVLGQALTVELGEPPAPPITVSNSLVAHGEQWHWRRGVSAPQTNWLIAADAELDGTWSRAAGGFGYGDDAIVGEATRLHPGMSNVHTTVFIRRTFEIPEGFNTNANLFLTVDYDDGFVAYLDGVELTRRNVPGAAGSQILHTATTGGISHEASCCNNPNPATVINLGPAGARLGAGSHILAVIGVNQEVESSDFHLRVDFSIIQSLPGTNGPVVNNGFYALSITNQITLGGSNTVAGATRVTVNGDDAAYNPETGRWLATRQIQPGWNRLYIAAHDAQGSILTNLWQEVIYQTAARRIGGTLNANLTVTNAGTVLYVTSDLLIPTNTVLSVGAGVVALTASGQNIAARDGGAIEVLGTETEPVIFRPDGGTNTMWGPLSARGAGSSLKIHFADISHSQVNCRDGATGVIEDSNLHDFDDPNGATFDRPLMLSSFSTRFNVRRCYFYNYHECLVRDGLIQVEDSFFEHMRGDALDFDGAAEGSYAQRNTYRHGNQGNVDAVDIGPGDTGGCTNTVIANSLMWDFPFDKGVSVGDNGESQGILITNCVIYGCDSGVAVKDRCSAVIANCTMVDNQFGINLRAKFPDTPPGTGGIITNSYNNIIWGSRIFPIWVTNNPVIVAHHSLMQGTNWPGEGNISLDPLFVDPAQKDYRLQAASPARGAGAQGADLGARFPVGGLGRPPLRLTAMPSASAISLRWVDDTENEDGVVVEKSTDGKTWTVLAVTAPNATNLIDTNLHAEVVYHYRARTTNWCGLSQPGNLAKAKLASAPALKLTISLAPEQRFVLSFDARAGQSYAVQHRGELVNGQWSEWQQVSAQPADGRVFLTNTLGAGQQFFRLLAK